MNDTSPHETMGRYTALKISVAYAVAGCLWLLFSDTLLPRVTKNLVMLGRLQTFMGMIFIVVTSVLLYVLIQRSLSVVRRFEQALLERQQSFRIFSGTSAAIFIYSDVIITANRAMERLTGYAEEELRVLRFYDLFPPDVRGLIEDHCDALLRDGSGPIGCELKLITKQGNERWIDFSSSSIDYDGKRCGLGTAFDITDRKQAEMTVKQSEERLRLLVEKVRDYEIFMLDPKGYIITWNVGGEKDKGYRADEILGSHHSIFFVTEDREAGVPERELTMAASEGSFEDEGWRVRKDGSLFWANVVTTALRDSARTLMGFSKVVRDVTDRKRAEEALRESEARYRIIAETASDVIITIDDQSIIQFVNPAAERVFGYLPEALIGQNITVLMPLRLRGAHLAAVKGYVETGKRTMSWGGIELSGVHKDGHEVPLEISYGEFRREGRHFFAGIIRDITERKEATRSKEYRQMLERFNQELETLVSERTLNLLAMTLADRVRNPASVIGATANRMLRKAECTEKGREDLALIIGEAGKLEQTVKDFLGMLKGRQALFQYEDICSIVRDVLPVIEKEAERKQIALSVDLPDRPLKINAERNLLKMAVFTVLKNAVELTPDEGKVTIVVLGDENRIRITVSDTGYGIPAEYADAIFDPFSSAHTYRFGMGLPLIKQIVSEHMGEISVASEIGKGAVVTMAFPVRWGGVSPDAGKGPTG